MWDQNSLAVGAGLDGNAGREKFLKKFWNRRNPLGFPIDYQSESAGLEVVPHQIPARHFFMPSVGRLASKYSEKTAKSPQE